MSEWTSVIPSEEGWYFQKRKALKNPIRVIRVQWAGSGKSRHLIYTGEGAFLYNDHLTESLFYKISEPPPVEFE